MMVIPKPLFYILILLFLCQTLQSQIGTKIPSDRLPGGGTLKWQEAGCTFLSEPIEVTAFLDVIEYGATGNGIDDDTDAFLSALEDAEQESNNGGFSIVFMPDGTYKISSVLEIPSNTVLKGNGSDKSTMHFNHYDNALISGQGIMHAGIEDVRLTRITDELHQKYFIRMDGASECWIRGVESYLGNSSHFTIKECNNIEISGCYIHECTDHGGGGNGYGIVLGDETHSCLIQDNVIRDARHSIVTGGHCYWNVAGYNASYDPHTTTSGGLPEWVTGDIELHGNSSNPGPDMGAAENLFEGNYFNWIWIDAYWGDNGRNNLFFRNIARKGGIVLEDHYESTNGGTHTNCNDSQLIVNNYCENLDLAVKVRYGSPWGDGYPFSNELGGGGHFARNNKTYKVVFPSGGTSVAWELEGEEPEFLNDTSYYLTARPGFIPQDSWPFDPFDINTRNPAALRYESGGLVTVTEGFSSYLISDIEEPEKSIKFSAYPNPCTRAVHLRYLIHDAGYVIFDVFTNDGRWIRRLGNEEKIPGEYKLEFDMRDLPAGVYFIRMQAGKEIIINKIVKVDR